MQDWFEQAVRPSDAQGAAQIAGAPNVWELSVTREQWRQATQNIAAGGGRLISLWASRDTGGENLVRAAFAADAGVLVLTLRLAGSQSHYPGHRTVVPQCKPHAARHCRSVRLAQHRCGSAAVAAPCCVARRLPSAERRGNSRSDCPACHR